LPIFFRQHMALAQPVIEERFGCPSGQVALYPVNFCDSPHSPKAAIAVHKEMHRVAVRAIRNADTRGHIRIGISLAMQGFHALPEGDVALARQHALLDEDTFLDLARECKDDFIGIQVYFVVPVGPDGPLLQDNWGLDASGLDGQQVEHADALVYASRYAAQRTGLPVLVTENGIVASDDTCRVEFLTRVVPCLDKCLQEGISMLGYIHWTFLDCYEWAKDTLFQAWAL